MNHDLKGDKKNYLQNYQLQHQDVVKYNSKPIGGCEICHSENFEYLFTVLLHSE